MQCFFYTDNEISSCSICRINKKGQMMKNLSETVFHKVYSMSSHSKTLKLSVLLRESGNLCSIMVTVYFICWIWHVYNQQNVIVFHKFSLNDEIIETVCSKSQTWTRWNRQAGTATNWHYLQGKKQLVCCIEFNAEFTRRPKYLRIYHITQSL